LSSRWKTPKDFEYGIDQLSTSIKGFGLSGEVETEIHKIWIYGERNTAAEFTYWEGRKLKGNNGSQERTQNLIC
jgi:hypothetical protein